MEQAVAGSLWNIEDIMNGSAMTADEWAAAFAENPLEAATAFADLNDAVRFNIGGILESMGGFGQASRGLIEDFTFNLEAIPLSMEEIRANIQANFATWGGTFAGEMRTGGRMVGAELTGMLDSLTASIESANLSEQASAEAFAMMDKMAKTIDQNGGTVTHGVDKMLRRIEALILDPANAAAAETGTEAIVNKIEEVLTTATPLIEKASKNVAGAAIEGFESARLADELAAKTRDAMLRTEAEILIGTPPVKTATAATGQAAIDGWEQVDFGTWLVNTINANMAAATTAIETATPLIQTAMTETGTDAGNGLVSGITATQPAVQAIINQMGMIAINTMRTTLQSHSDSKVFVSIGRDIGGGLATGIAESTPDVAAAVTDMGVTLIGVGVGVGRQLGTMSGDTAITSTINAIQDGSVDLEAAWKDIEERMKKINDTAATSGGASYAQRWYQSMLDGIAAGTVSAATAVEIMTGVLYNAATWTGNGASPQRQDWVAFLQSQLDALMKNNAEMISDTFHGPPTEDTTGIGQGNDYWDRLAREIEARMGGRRTPGEDSAKTKTKHKYGPQIPDPLEEMSVLDKAVSEMISDGIIDIADVLKARTGGFDPLAEALLQGIAGMFSSADISKLANLGLGDELIMAIFEMLTPQIPDSAVGPMDDDEGMWVPSEEDQNSFVGQSVVYEVHLDGAGYISDVDALARDLELAASRRGE